mmetsp:Transcript_360/g.1201  ORF Transcript_360/g.1201 Transcript_360/m.1201 type:complete len:262 (+) Transcript_360:405-1190(+)
MYSNPFKSSLEGVFLFFFSLFLYTFFASSVAIFIFSGAFANSHVVQINIAAEVSWPANKNVLISSHICLSTSGPYSLFGTSANTRSKISACGLSMESSAFGVAVTECFNFHLCLINLITYAFNFFTLSLWSKYSLFGKYALHGSKLRRLHSSIIGKYKFGITSSDSSGDKLKIASPITCNVSNLNSSANSISSPVPLIFSNFTHNLSTALVAISTTSSKISILSACDIRPRCRFQLSPSLVTKPVPKISKNGLYANSVSFP